MHVAQTFKALNRILNTCLLTSLFYTIRTLLNIYTFTMMMTTYTTDFGVIYNLLTYLLIYITRNRQLQLTFLDASDNRSKVVVKKDHISRLFTDVRPSDSHGNACAQHQQLHINGIVVAREGPNTQMFEYWIHITDNDNDATMYWVMTIWLTNTSVFDNN